MNKPNNRINETISNHISVYFPHKSKYSAIIPILTNPNSIYVQMNGALNEPDRNLETSLFINSDVRRNNKLLIVH